MVYGVHYQIAPNELRGGVVGVETLFANVGVWAPCE
jgi:hypothetical protein